MNHPIINAQGKIITEVLAVGYYLLGRSTFVGKIVPRYTVPINQESK